MINASEITEDLPEREGIIINNGALEHVIATPEGPQPNAFYDPCDGWQYLRTMRASKRINNFRTQIIKEVDVILGGGKAQRSLDVRCTLLSGKFMDITLEARHLKSSGALEDALANMLTKDFIVEDKMYGHLKVAMQELSLPKGWERVQAIATTGWIEDGDEFKFILPSAKGAITGDGIDPNIFFDHEYLPYELRDGFKKLRGYGKGVRPALNGDELQISYSAFRRLVECAPEQVTVPVVMQVLAGPLCGLGADSPPPLVHVMGKTGGKKTTIVRCAMGLMGNFGTGYMGDEQTEILATNATPISIGTMLNNARQVTLLLDDFKRGARSEQFSQLIQNYGDRTGRTRARQDGTISEGRAPQGLLLSTGEDVWETGASGLARTIVVDLPYGAITNEKITPVQNAVRDGWLAIFGGTYISWLARQRDIMEGTAFGVIAKEQHAALSAKFGDVHGRLTASLATLLTVGVIIERFLRDAFGEAAATWFHDRVNAALPVLLGSMQQQAEEIEEGSPYQTLLAVLREVLTAHEACLAPAKPSEFRPLLPYGVTLRADVVGFYLTEVQGALVQEPHVLLTKDLTYGWYCARLRRQGNESGFGWAALRKEMLVEDGIPVDRIRIVESDKGQLSGVAVPISALLPDADTWRHTVRS